MAQLVKNLPAVLETWVRSLGWEDPLEKGTATHSSILAWRIPWTVCGHKEWDMTEQLSLNHLTYKAVSKQYSFCTSSSLENKELLCLSKVCILLAWSSMFSRCRRLDR